MHKVSRRIRTVEEIAALSEFESALVTRTEHCASGQYDEVVEFVELFRYVLYLSVHIEYFLYSVGKLVHIEIEISAERVSKHIKSKEFSYICLGCSYALFFLYVHKEVEVCVFSNRALRIVGYGNGERAVFHSFLHYGDSIFGHTALGDNYHTGMLHIHVAIVYSSERGMIFAYFNTSLEGAYERKYCCGIVRGTACHRNDIGYFLFFKSFCDCGKYGSTSRYRAL